MSRLIHSQFCYLLFVVSFLISFQNMLLSIIHQYCVKNTRIHYYINRLNNRRDIFSYIFILLKDHLKIEICEKNIKLNFQLIRNSFFRIKTLYVLF